tara:strand:- start:237 stop:734 length:498 start_codon:yes stop_codon:yes gene_type:complete
MKLDHVAFRVRDRYKTVDFIKRTLGYEVGAEFDIKFDDGSITECFALAGPMIPEVMVREGPEIFVSDGSPDSIVGKWVEERNGGGVHHFAYKVADIDEVYKEWKDNGIEFLSDDIIDCPEDNLRQIFTKPLEEFGGVIIELIQRGHKGFCQNSVKNLMESTKELK